MMCRRDSPRSVTPSPTMPLDLVAITISSRRPRRARPRICSAGSRSAAAGAPGRSKTGMLPYTSAVSTKLMPRSIAAPTIRSASCAAGATPNVAVPRQIRDTCTPVVPSTEYRIRVSLPPMDRPRNASARSFKGLGLLLGEFEDGGPGEARHGTGRWGLGAGAVGVVTPHPLLRAGCRPWGLFGVGDGFGPVDDVVLVVGLVDG